MLPAPDPAFAAGRRFDPAAVYPVREPRFGPAPHQRVHGVKHPYAEKRGRRVRRLDRNVSYGVARQVLSFTAVSNRSYTVLFRADRPFGSWEKLTDVPSAPAMRPAWITNRAAINSVRFYRLVTPKQSGSPSP
jgi:hypothetical protein